ncbi:MAG: hypothetical protein ACREMY_05095 [bacterium]
MRRSHRVRIQMDFVLVFSEELDALPVGISKLADELCDAVELVVADAYGRAEHNGTNIDLRLDLRKPKEGDVDHAGQAGMVNRVRASDVKLGSKNRKRRRGLAPPKRGPIPPEAG